MIQYEYNQSNLYQYCYIPIFGIAEVQKADFKSSDIRNSRNKENRLQEFRFSEKRQFNIQMTITHEREVYYFSYTWGRLAENHQCLLIID